MLPKDFQIKIKTLPNISPELLKNNGSEPLLNTLRKAKIEIPTSCENGLCATCKGRLYRGSVSYPEIQPEGLLPEEAEQGDILLCCAHPTSDCEIDHPELLAPGEFPSRFFKIETFEFKQIHPHVLELSLFFNPQTFFNFLPGQYAELILNNQRYPLSMAMPPKHNQNNPIIFHIVQTELDKPHLLIEALKKLKELKELKKNTDTNTNQFLLLEGPKGRSYFKKENFPHHSQKNTDFIFIAGGGGITPMWSMIPEALSNLSAENSDTTHKVHLYWGVRDETLLYQKNIIQTWSEKYSSDYFKFTTSVGSPIHEAVFNDLKPHLFSHPIFFIAGPPAMVKTIYNALTQQFGIPSEQIFGDGIAFV